MEIKALLAAMNEQGASDLYLSTGARPAIKVEGKLVALPFDPIASQQVQSLAYPMLSPEKIKEFESKLELNFAFQDPQLGRFRMNLFITRNETAMVVRRIQLKIPNPEILGLPPILQQIVMENRGLVLFVGATGCGKSTSLASLIDYRNQNSAGHIITIEDPIEYLHTHKKSIVNQREVGLDTLAYQNALENTLRQAPDVILIGEIRSRETMEQAIAFSETGHLCLSTLHANNANQAFDRIINFFPPEKRNQILLDLSFNMRAFISQRLVNQVNGKRTAAVEVLLGTPLILSLIRRGDIDQIKEAMERSETQGMETFDHALEKLHAEGKISADEAIRNADSKNNVRLTINLQEKAKKGADADSNLEISSLDANLIQPDENQSNQSKN